MNAESPYPWMVCFVAGMTLVGRRKEGTELHDVLQLKILFQQVEKGMKIQYVAEPVLLCGNLDILDVGESAVWKPIAGLSIERMVMSAIREGEQRKGEMRSAAAGLTLAHSMPRH